MASSKRARRRRRQARDRAFAKMMKTSNIWKTVRTVLKSWTDLAASLKLVVGSGAYTDRYLSLGMGNRPCDS